MTSAQLAILQRDAETGLGFAHHLTQTRGRWCIAPRLTPRLRDSGYAVALTQKRYIELRCAWERERYGATLAGIEAAGPQMLAALIQIRHGAGQAGAVDHTSALGLLAVLANLAEEAIAAAQA